MRRQRPSCHRVLALSVFVLTAVALAACGGEEEATPTAAPAASPTAMATPTPEPSPTAAPTLPPSPTLPPGGETPALMPSWQTAAPRAPAPIGQVVELGIRNKNGAPGETYAIGVQVNLPDGSPVNMEGEVVGDGWAYFSLAETSLPGTYTVYFGLPQSDLIYAQDFFKVQEPEPPPGTDFTTLTWQTSAPRVAVGIGEVVELGLRNKFGEPGECYDFLMEVYDPMDGYSSGEATVCADEWAYLPYEDTFLSGTYYVFFWIEDQLIAQDSFEVSEY